MDTKIDPYICVRQWTGYGPRQQPRQGHYHGPWWQAGHEFPSWQHHPHSHTGVALADCELTMQPKLSTQELWSCRKFWSYWSETPHPNKEIGSKREELEITLY